MAHIKFQLDYIVPATATLEEAIEMVKDWIANDGISTAINEDNVTEFENK